MAANNAGWMAEHHLVSGWIPHQHKHMLNPPTNLLALMAGSDQQL